MRRRANTYRFPWRPAHRLRLLIDGTTFLPAMEQAVRGARHYVLLELYLVQSGHVAERFIAALGEAAARGVRVYVLLDGFGSQGLSQHDRQRLTGRGVRVAVYNPVRLTKWKLNLFRDHRKLLVVDGALAFVGGMGMTDDFDPAVRPEDYWHEAMVAVAGPNVSDWHDLFVENWVRWGEKDDLPGADAPETGGGQWGRVAVLHRTHRREIYRSFLKQIRSARRRVWWVTPYFAPSVRLRRALRQAARRGVDVRLLLPGERTDHPAVRHAGRRYYWRLLRNGIRIFEYRPRFIHCKIMVCDDWVSVGSWNGDRWNLKWNLEASQEADSVTFASEVAAMFEADFSSSQEQRLEAWQRRPWYGRLRERFWGCVDRWLDRQKGIDGQRWDSPSHSPEDPPALPLASEPGSSSRARDDEGAGHAPAIAAPKSQSAGPGPTP